MALKLLNTFPLILLAITLHLSIVSSVGTKGVRLGFSNEMPKIHPVRMLIYNEGHKEVANILMRPRSGRLVKLDGSEKKYFATAEFGQVKHTAEFVLYDPVRDNGQELIVWKIDRMGFHLSQKDTNQYKLISPWLPGKKN